MTGRLPILRSDPQLVDRFLQGVAAGASIAGSAGAVGLGESTIHLWLQRGRAERERLERRGARPRRSEAIYVEFLARYEKARGQREIGALAIIRKAAQGGSVIDRRVTTTTRTLRDGSTVEETREESTYQAPQWTAAAWLLERTMPEQYSLRVRHGGDPEAAPIRQELVVRYVDDWRDTGGAPAAPDGASDPAADQSGEI